MVATTVALEQRVRAAVSPARLQAGLEVFSTLFRDSGSEDEWQAARYLVHELGERGVEAEILELPSLISRPKEGRLAVLDEDGNDGESFQVRTRSFGQQTPPGGIAAELVFVPFQAPERGEMIFSHRAVAGYYAGLNLRGKIVLTADGGPDGVRRAQERGASRHIHRRRCSARRSTSPCPSWRSNRSSRRTWRCPRRWRG